MRGWHLPRLLWRRRLHCLVSCDNVCGVDAMHWLEPSILGPLRWSWLCINVLLCPILGSGCPLQSTQN